MKYLGFVLLVLSGNVMSEEVYYCEDYNERSVGFIVNTMNLKTQPRQYLENNIYKTKFQIELQTDGNISIKTPDEPKKKRFICSFTSEGQYGKDEKSCVSESNNGDHLNYNLSNRRYVWLKGSGYVFNEVKPVSVNIGICTKF
jgi:hypothetical protein